MGEKKKGPMGLSYPLMVEVLDLLAEHKVLKQGGTSLASLQTGLVGDGTSNVRGHIGVAVIEVELGQKLLSFHRCTLFTTAVKVMRIVSKGSWKLACHDRTCCTRNADESRQESN